MQLLTPERAGVAAIAAVVLLLTGACTSPATPAPTGSPTETVAQRVEALRWLARDHTLAGDPETAAVHLRAARDLAPNDPWIHYALGTAHHTMGEYHDALEAYTRAIQLDPGHVKAWQWRAYTRALLGEPAGAVEDLSRALALLETAEPDAFEAWEGDRAEMIRWTLEERARAFDALGEPCRAAQDRERAQGSRF